MVLCEGGGNNVTKREPSLVNIQENMLDCGLKVIETAEVLSRDSFPVTLCFSFGVTGLPSHLTISFINRSTSRPLQVGVYAARSQRGFWPAPLRTPRRKTTLPQVSQSLETNALKSSSEAKRHHRSYKTQVMKDSTCSKGMRGRQFFIVLTFPLMATASFIASPSLRTCTLSRILRMEPEAGIKQA